MPALQGKTRLTVIKITGRFHIFKAFLNVAPGAILAKLILVGISVASGTILKFNPSELLITFTLPHAFGMTFFAGNIDMPGF